VLRAAEVFPPDRAPLAVEPSTLLQPRVLEYTREAWRGY
jgi:spermidine synthase